MKKKNEKFCCPCCGYYTLEEGNGNYEICPVCFWEDDAIQNRNADLEGGANKVSLNIARANYGKYGACEERFVNLVREPMQEEYGYGENVETI